MRMGKILYDNLSNEQLLDILRNKAKEIGKSPTKNDLGKKNNLPSETTFYRKFNTQSWNEILHLAGLELNHFQGYTKEESLDKLNEYYKTYNKILTREEFKKYNLIPAYDFYRKNFGSYKNACFEVGLIEKPLTDQERIKISIDELSKLANKLNRCPTVAEYENITHKGFVRRVLERKLNLKYNDICRQYIPHYKLNNEMDIPKEKILQDIKDVCEKLGRPPLFGELKDFGLSYSFTIFNSKFGMNYNELIISMGYIPTGSTTLVRTKDEMLQNFNDLFIKLKRVPIVEDFSHNNNIADYSTYIRYFGSIEKVCKLLNIDFERYYKGKTPGKKCLDKNGDKCRSFMECVITNYFIDNNIKYEKENYYNELIQNDARRFDWKLFVNNKIYYVEYAGMYYLKKMDYGINRNYVNRTNQKIQDLKEIGCYNECLFIFPEDIKTKTLKEIFEPFLGIKLEENKSNYNIPTIEYYSKTSEELLEIIMKYSDDKNILPSTSIIAKEEAGVYKEILKRYHTYQNFAQHFGKQTRNKIRKLAS